MTTAARPTFDPAKGGRERGDLSTLSKQYSSRDLPSHTKLKYRQDTQIVSDDVSSKDLKRQLDEKEAAASSSSTSRSRKRNRPELLDVDDPVDSDPESNDGSDDDDDEAELLAELNRIKKERAQEMLKKEQEKKIESEKIRTENILTGNPLLQRTENGGPADFKVKRRWDDDVVFKNCAKDEEDKKSKGFVNDTLRSEFHKKFLTKYIK